VATLAVLEDGEELVVGRWRYTRQETAPNPDPNHAAWAFVEQTSGYSQCGIDYWSIANETKQREVDSPDVCEWAWGEGTLAPIVLGD
jgi:hypothetical protein